MVEKLFGVFCVCDLWKLCTLAALKYSTDQYFLACSLIHSTPLSSEAVNLCIDPAPHEFSTGKLENVHSMFPCAGIGQCRVAAWWQRQGGEAAGQSASCSPLESLQRTLKELLPPWLLPWKSSFHLIHLSEKSQGTCCQFLTRRVWFFSLHSSSAVQAFQDHLQNIFCSYLNLFCSVSFLHNTLLVFKRDTFFFVLDPKKLINTVGLHEGCKRISASSSTQNYG